MSGADYHGGAGRARPVAAGRTGRAPGRRLRSPRGRLPGARARASASRPRPTSRRSPTVSSSTGCARRSPGWAPTPPPTSRPSQPFRRRERRSPRPPPPSTSRPSSTPACSPARAGRPCAAYASQYLDARARPGARARLNGAAAAYAAATYEAEGVAPADLPRELPDHVADRARVPVLPLPSRRGRVGRRRLSRSRPACAARSTRSCASTRRPSSPGSPAPCGRPGWPDYTAPSPSCWPYTSLWSSARSPPAAVTGRRSRAAGVMDRAQAPRRRPARLRRDSARRRRRRCAL